MFVGREQELNQLNKLYDKGGFQMVVVYGRRRVGKTALIQQFGYNKRTLYFTALEQADKDNLADFSRKIYEFFDLPQAGSFLSWAEAIDYLGKRAEKERFVFIFDELPYAAKRNTSLPSVLQIAIDHQLKKTELFMILCGSNQGFMESEVLGRKSPLYGRRTAQIRLTQLGYLDAAKMLAGLSVQDQFRYYGCFGGVPYYLELINPGLSLEENLVALYFDPMGFLYDEPYGLLRQEFSEPALYASILRAIAGGANRVSEIANQVGVEPTTLPKYLKSLEAMSIVEKKVPFGAGSASKKGIYCVADACYDFWFCFVMPRVADIESGLGKLVANDLTVGRFSEYLGRRFERLALEWLRNQALEGQLPLRATSVGSWWGTNPQKRAQDDIDALAADTEKKQLLICECKYRDSFNETAVLQNLEAKHNLVKGYTATHFALLSKRPLSMGTQKKASERDDLLLVTLEDMYGKG